YFVFSGSGGIIEKASSGQDIQLTSSLAAIQSSLRTLTYKASGTTADLLSITVSDFAGSSSTSTSITNASSTQQFDWAGSRAGSFGDSTNWTLTGGPPGGNDIAAFGSGRQTVSGGGAVGEILVSANTTLTGEVTAQGIASAGPA